MPPRQRSTEPRIVEGRELLAALGLPPPQQNDVAACTLLALTDVKPSTSWADAQRPSLRIHDMLTFTAAHYEKVYAENSRETFRRKAIHQFEQARLVDRNPDDAALPTNHPRTHYAVTEEALRVVRAFKTESFEKELAAFKAQHGSLLELYRARRARNEVPLTLADGRTLNLTPGKHNALQVAIIKEFVPAFANDAKLLYLGDTANKDLIREVERLEALFIPITEHDKLPDIVIEVPARKRLFLIEAVTSHGPVSPKRKLELEAVFRACPLEKLFVSAFPDLKGFKRHLHDIAWETEVWIAEIPDHLIHFNGDKFL